MSGRSFETLLKRSCLSSSDFSLYTLWPLLPSPLPAALGKTLPLHPTGHERFQLSLSSLWTSTFATFLKHFLITTLLCCLNLHLTPQNFEHFDEDPSNSSGQGSSSSRKWIAAKTDPNFIGYTYKNFEAVQPEDGELARRGSGGEGHRVGELGMGRATGPRCWRQIDGIHMNRSWCNQVTVGERRWTVGG